MKTTTTLFTDTAKTDMAPATRTHIGYSGNDNQTLSKRKLYQNLTMGKKKTQEYMKYTTTGLEKIAYEG